jgi:hypothetical protein
MTAADKSTEFWLFGYGYVPTICRLDILVALSDVGTRDSLRRSPVDAQALFVPAHVVHPISDGYPTYRSLIWKPPPHFGIGPPLCISCSLLCQKHVANTY